MTTLTGTEIFTEGKDKPGWVIPILEEAGGTLTDFSGSRTIFGG